jgi:hypothetical protein
LDFKLGSRSIIIPPSVLFPSRPRRTASSESILVRLRGSGPHPC